MRKWTVTGTSMEVEAEDAEAAVQRAEQQSGWHWEATEVGPPLPRDEDGRIKTSASYGDLWFVRVTYNTDPEGTWVEDDDWSNSTLHGDPFFTKAEAEQWMEDYPDGDTDIKDMDIILVNAVRPITKTFTAEDIMTLANNALDDIDEFVGGLPDEGARDALNLIVNLIGTRAEHPDQTLSVEDIIGTNYDADPETVKGWIES